MTVRPASDELTTRDVAALLSGTLGWEKSQELVSAVVQARGYSADKLTTGEAIDILETLSRQQGIVGVTARFARSRTDSLRAAIRRRASTTPLPANPPTGPAPPSSASSAVLHAVQTEGEQTSPAPPKRLPLSDLVALLAPTIGQEKSQEAIAHACRTKKVNDERVTLEQAVSLFEVLAEQEGLVGVTARFAKARLVFRFRGSAP